MFDVEPIYKVIIVRSSVPFIQQVMVTDKNKNQYVEFVFNVKNSGGDTVIGVEGYGQ